MKPRRALTHPVIGPYAAAPLYFAWRWVFRYKPWLSDRKAITSRYRKIFGVTPDLDNPRGFNEKIQWLKLNDRDPMKVTCSDKIMVRDYITDTVGERYTIPLLGIYTSPDAITPEILPDAPFVIKTNHDQGTVFPVLDKTTADFEHIRGYLRLALRRNLYHVMREWPYDRINPRRILVEPHLKPDDPESIKDYKVYCFNGEPGLIFVVSNRSRDDRRNFYTSTWDSVDVEAGYPQGDVEPPPERLDEMLHVARRLSERFHFVRVDFFIVDGKPKVGEMTFFPVGGFIHFEPRDFDITMGNMLELPDTTR